MRRAAKRLVSDVTSRKNKEAEFQSSGCPLRAPLGTNARTRARTRARATDGFARAICGVVITPNPSRRRINDLIDAVLYRRATVCCKIHEMSQKEIIVKID